MKASEFDAGTYTLSEIREMLDEIEKEYGPEAKLCFDAGYNNISLDIVC